VMMGLTRRRPAKHLDVWRAPDSTKPPERPVERFGVKVMSTQFLLAEEQSVAVDAPFAELLVDRMTERLDWGALDWLFIDLPPGTADLQQLVARRIRPDGVILIVTPQDVAHLDAKKAITMFRQRRIPIVGGIENMTGLTCPCCSTVLTIFPAVAPERSIWADGVERIATIPIETAIAEATECGTPVVIRHPDSDAARAFAALAEKLSTT
jgi:ATP-binding protein involved in chromosome partitioning